MNETKTSTNNPYDAKLLTKQELAECLNLPSTRILDELVGKRLIPIIRLGHRTVRFNWADVKAALEKMTVWDHSTAKGKAAVIAPQSKYQSLGNRPSRSVSPKGMGLQRH